MLVDRVQRNLFECHLVPSKVTQIIPAHSIDVRLADLFGKLGVMPGQESVEVFINDKSSLLNDLSIDTRRTQSLDLRNKKISNPLNCLRGRVNSG